MSFINIKTCGGLGNLLFQIFNGISLSIKYNRQIYFENNYNLSKYKIFNNINQNKIINNNIIKFEEKEFKYNFINLNENNNYIIHGYFQSYKYFYEYFNEIKKKLYIDFDLINKIKTEYCKFNKKTISIHIRLGDYLNLQNIYVILSFEYYKKILSNFNLDDYQIIIFTNDKYNSKKILNNLNLNNFIYSDEIKIYSNQIKIDSDENDFYKLCLTDIHICANSTFSLMACYINEIYNFIEDSKYYIPKNWFEKEGPDYDILDFKLNDKFIII